MKTAGAVLAAGLVALARVHGASYSVVHGFGILTNVTGANPVAPLVQGADGTLYGTTPTGEGNAAGTVFRVRADGTGFSVLKYFTNLVEGANPQAGLVLSGNRLYGTTAFGGLFTNGNVFALNTNGTAFSNLYSFSAQDVTTGTNADGANPLAVLVLSGKTLFGTASAGGFTDNGAVFALNTNGSGFTNIYSFSAPDPNTGDNADGAYPQAGLTISGNTLFGTAAFGGGNAYGTVFSLSTNGDGFSTLYTFTGNGDGDTPLSAMVFTNGTLYGTASGQYGNAYGAVFALDTNSLLMTPLYSFADGADGGYPDGGIVLSGGTLCGTTAQAGAGNNGTIFAVDTGGTTFTTLFRFGGPNGADSEASLIQAGAVVYGTTQYGGSGGLGTVFSFNTNSTLQTLFAFHASDGSVPDAAVILVGSTLFGTTASGGAGGSGTVFAVNTNGTGYTNIYSFSATDPDTATNSDGAVPEAPLILSGNTLYGTASAGGSAGSGTIFALSTNGAHFTNLYSFSATDPNTGANSDGATPYAALTLSGSTLFGSAAFGGANGYGTLFALNTNGAGFAQLYSFTLAGPNAETNTDGASPLGSLMVTGSVLYGTASGGGLNGYGTLFSYDTNAQVFTTLWNFSGPESPYSGGSLGGPYGGLVLAGTTMYGALAASGASSNGTVFGFQLATETYIDIYDFSATDTNYFTNSDGIYPLGGVVLSGATMYGTAYEGGNDGYGTLYSISTNRTGFAALYTFTGGNDGAYPVGELARSGNTLFGVAQAGGPLGEGVIFALNAAATTRPALGIRLIPGEAVLTWNAAAFSLQSATNVAGPYSTIIGASSPYTNAISGSRKFFRLVE